jgi:transcriptional regulator with XRE-family HTH domain
MTLRATIKHNADPKEDLALIPTDEAFRDALRDVVARSGLSMRALSAAMGRDPGYIAALLDPTRPSRARPTPADLLAASDATGISFVELLDRLWGIEPERLADELRSLGDAGPEAPMGRLSADERALVADFVELLVARRTRRLRTGGPR